MSVSARKRLSGLSMSGIMILFAACAPLFNPGRSLASPVDCAAASPPAVAASPAASPAASAEAIPTQAAIQQEVNPPGDIPDNQAFVVYTSADGGYSVSMPEGWARTENGPDVAFADKLHTFMVTVRCDGSAPTVDSVKQNEVPMLLQQLSAFALTDVSEVAIPAGTAIKLRYQINSPPDEVTGKQYRLDVEQFEFYQDGKLARLSLAVPAGSDNVDVSNLVSKSFTWVK